MLLSAGPLQNRVGALEVGASLKSKLELGNYSRSDLYLYCIYFIALFWFLIKALITTVDFCVLCIHTHIYICCWQSLEQLKIYI